MFCTGFLECNFCQLGNSKVLCSQNANCLQIPAGYTCYCKPGFVQVPSTTGKHVQCLKKFSEKVSFLFFGNYVIFCIPLTLAYPDLVNPDFGLSGRWTSNNGHQLLFSLPFNVFSPGHGARVMRFFGPLNSVNSLECTYCKGKQNCSFAVLYLFQESYFLLICYVYLCYPDQLLHNLVRKNEIKCNYNFQNSTAAKPFSFLFPRFFVRMN